MYKPVHQRDFSSCISFKAVRSSGKGGQHVNKVSTRVELYIDLNSCDALTEEEKELLWQRLPHKQGVIRLVCDETRSQYRNRKQCIERWKEKLIEVFKPEKERKPSAPTHASVKKRLEQKDKRSLLKKSRKPPRGWSALD